MTKTAAVKLVSGLLDDHESRGGTIILRGILDLATALNLQRDIYQRERFSLGELKPLLDGLRNGQSFPDIELGMRGQSYDEKDGAFYLRDSVYVIDGLQRLTATAHHLQQNPTASIRQGCLIHFDTTLEWETERFRILNTQRRKVSPNILLRNTRNSSNATATLFGLTHNDTTFALYQKVTWSQSVQRGEMITALVLAKTWGQLHSHRAPTKSNSWQELYSQLDRASEIIGLQNMRDNLKHFFDVVDEAWGVRQIMCRENAPQLKSTFLHVLARFFADHVDFWKNSKDESRLHIEPSIRRKLAGFPITSDPFLMGLAATAGKSRDHLYLLIVQHVNSGKRTKRLTSRRSEDLPPLEEENTVTV